MSKRGLSQRRSEEMKDLLAELGHTSSFLLCVAPLRRCESIPAPFFDVIRGCRILRALREAFLQSASR
jgi:hypothetical protein